MHRLTVGIAARFVAITTLTSLIGVAAIAGPVQAAPARIGHGATAYGTSVTVSSVFSSGPTALATLGCTNRAFLDHVNSAASGGIPAAGTVGAVTDEVSTTPNSTTATSTIGAITLFSGLITADAISPTATASTDGTTFSTSGGTTFTNLVINGTPETEALPNTVIPLPGLGSVTVDEEISKIKSDSASMIVNALDIDITASNEFGFPVGAQIIVGHANASLNDIGNRLLDGHAFGTQVNGVGAVSGKSALVVMPCQGTDGATRTNSIAGTTIPDVISTGTETSTASGTAAPGFADGTTTNAVQNVSLLNGVITVDAVKAQANASASGKNKTFTDTGSSFDNIAVLGMGTIPDDVPPNTMYTIPSVGTLYLHRIITRSHHIEVRMIEIVLGVALDGLPAGTDIRIADAEASVH